MDRQSIDPAMATLLRGRQPQMGQMPQAPPPPWPKGKCVQITLPYSGLTYWVPDDRMYPSPVGLVMPVAYTPRMAGAEVIGVDKHEQLHFVAAGFIAETVDWPPWWPEKG